MGYTKHNTIVVTCWDETDLKEARKQAVKIFNECFKGEAMGDKFGSRLVSNIIKGLANAQDSFFIAPDGSKEGWQTSHSGDEARKQFCDWLDDKPDNYCDYVEIKFGGDTQASSLVRSRFFKSEDE